MRAQDWGSHSIACEGNNHMWHGVMWCEAMWSSSVDRHRCFGVDYSSSCTMSHPSKTFYLSKTKKYGIIWVTYSILSTYQGVCKLHFASATSDPNLLFWNITVGSLLA